MNVSSRAPERSKVKAIRKRLKSGVRVRDADENLGLIRRRRLFRIGMGGLLMCLTSLWFLFLQKPDTSVGAPSSWLSWSWWWQPWEVNPLKRLQTLPRVTFNDVWTDPGGTRLWAVGEGGVIVHSKDAGETWEVQPVEWGDPAEPIDEQSARRMAQSVASVLNAAIAAGYDTANLSAYMTPHALIDLAVTGITPTDGPFKGKTFTVGSIDETARPAVAKYLAWDDSNKSVVYGTQESTSQTQSQGFLVAVRKSRDRVVSPYPPYVELDIGGLEPGSLALDPTKQKVFEVPPYTSATLTGENAPSKSLPVPVAVSADESMKPEDRALTRVLMSPDCLHGWAMTRQHLLVTQDGGAHWLRVDAAPFKGATLTDITWAAEGALQVLFTRWDSAALLFETKDHGKTWVEKKVNVDSPRCMTYAKDGSYALIGTKSGLWKMQAGSSSTVNRQPGNFRGGQGSLAMEITDVVISETGQEAWAGSAEGLLYSSDSGETWERVNLEGAPPSPISANEDDGTDIYIVKPGDTLYSVASRFSLTPKQLIELNRLPDNYIIGVGDELRVPSRKAPRGIVAYRLQKGDDIETVAALFSTTPGRIRELNRMSPDRKLKEGDEVVVPALGAVTLDGSGPLLLGSVDGGIRQAEESLRQFPLESPGGPQSQQNPAKEAPRAGGPAIQSIRFSSDRKHGFLAVWTFQPGNSGYPGLRWFRTEDRGKNWSRLAGSSEMRSAKAVTLDQHGKTVWFVGEGGLVLRGGDTDASWEPVCANAQPALFRAQFDRTGAYGWAISTSQVSRASGSQRAAVWQTKDGGRSWSETKQESDPEGVFSPAFYLLPERHEYWGVASGRLTHGKDGISTLVRSGPLGFDATALFFLENGLTGWIGTPTGLVYQTQDGGMSWGLTGELPTGLKLPEPEPGAEIHDLRFLPDGLRGWMAAGDGLWWTEDSGVKWHRALLKDVAEDGIHPAFLDLAVTSSGSRLWACDRSGAVWASSDGGRQWAVQLRQPVVFVDVHFQPDGLSGWAVGTSGHAWRTTDGGVLWSQCETGTTTNLYSVWFAENGVKGVLTGDHGTTLETNDGGVTWTDARTYHRHPAPAYWVAMSLIGLLFFRFKTGDLSSVPQIETIADHYLSDRPLQEGDFDALDLKSLARGLTNYLENRDTGAPLTLAINGAWGSGKSSLMNLVKQDLEKRGFRPVWFNAWHHQKEEHMLAAMLDSIRRQCVPSLWSLNGVAFRIRLMKLRLRGSLPRTLFLTAILTLGLGLVWTNLDVIEGLFRKLQEGSPGKSGLTFDVVLKSLAGIGGLALILRPLQLFFESIKAFGVDPAKIMATMSKNARISDLRAQTSFRYQFAQEFGEVTQALQPDHRLVIFIDDLDRCQPEQMMLVLENVNYLTGAGECFVILGMEEETVKDCLATQMEWRFKDKIANETDAEKRMAARREYVDKWLEKMVQVRVFMPTMSEEQAVSLMTVDTAGPDSELPGKSRAKKSEAEDGREEKPHPGEKGLRVVKGLLYGAWVNCRLLLAFGIITALSFGGGSMIRLDAFLKPKAPETQALPVKEAAKPAAAEPNAGPAPSPASPQTAEAPKASTQPSDNPVQNGNTSPPKMPVVDTSLSIARPMEALVIQPGAVSYGTFWSGIPFLTAMLLLIALLVWRLLIYSRQPKVTDSVAFIAAVKEWCPLMMQRSNTPRSLKRFINKVRFYAMLVREDQSDPGTQELEKLLVGFGFVEDRFKTLPGSDWRINLADIPDLKDADKARIAQIMEDIDQLHRSQKARSFFRMKNTWR